MGDNTEGKAVVKGKPYDMWSISCGVVSLLCFGWWFGLYQSLDPDSLLQHGPPMGSVQSAQQLILLLALGIRVTAITSFVTGLVGLFLYRSSRWLALTGLLLSTPLVFYFYVVAIATAMKLF